MIYLDHNATTPVDPGVFAAMEPFLTRSYGNPSSVHSAGREARRAVEEARESVAAFIGAGSPDEIVFTSGGTEADALALSIAESLEGRQGIAVSTVEHPAVREAARSLEQRGHAVARITVCADGSIDLPGARVAVNDQTGIVSVMAANNEYGGIFPVAALSEIAHARGALFHCDAVAALAKIPVDVRAWQADLVSVSAHKIHGPKGSGALYVRRGVDVQPLLSGGGQERRRRGGTENVAGIVGFGEAASQAASGMAAENRRIAGIRDAFEMNLAKALPGIRIWALDSTRLPNTSAVAFPGCSAETLLIALDLSGIAASAGSACSSGTLEPSPSILALGASPSEARGTLRFSFGRANRSDEIEPVVRALCRAASKHMA
jgi:cysteine desulfurase